MSKCNVFKQFDYNLLKIESTQETAFTRHQEISRIIEALLFASAEPLTLVKIRDIVSTSYPITTNELATLIEKMQRRWKEEGRAIRLDEIASGYLLRTEEQMRPFIERLHQERRGEKLSPAAVETLAIIAHKQPITRAEIEKIRGVDSSGTLSSLQERHLIEIVGRKEAPGRPSEYSITKRFLKHFGLCQLTELTAKEGKELH